MIFKLLRIMITILTVIMMKFLIFDITFNKNFKRKINTFIKLKL